MGHVPSFAPLPPPCGQSPWHQDKLHVPPNVAPCPQAHLSLHRPCPSRSNNLELLIAPTPAAQRCIFTLPCLCPMAQPRRRLLLSSDARKALPLSQAQCAQALFSGCCWIATTFTPARPASGWASLRPPPCACHCSHRTGLQSLRAGPSPLPDSELPEGRDWCCLPESCTFPGMWYVVNKCWLNNLH